MHDIVSGDGSRWSIDAILRFLEVVDQDFPTPLSQQQPLEDYARKLHDNATLSVYEDDGLIAGMAAAYANRPDLGVAYVTMYGIRPEYRGQGLGQELLLRVLEACRDRGFPRIHLYVAKSNVQSKAIQEKLGGELREVPDDPRPDDLHYFYDWDVNQYEIR